MFETADLEQMTSRGISLQNIENQINSFKKGFPYVVLESPATVGNGIKRLDHERVRQYVSYFDQRKHVNGICKFVPASGAATRMFKDLFEFKDAFQDSDGPLPFVKWKNDYPSVHMFFQNLKHFAFIDLLRQQIRISGDELDNIMNQEEYVRIIHFLLSPDGLNYASLPKGLLAFHRYPDEIRTPVEEHLVEGAQYARDKTDRVTIHFTVSPEHLEGFQQRVRMVKDRMEQQFCVAFEVGYSVQKPSTDTIAVDLSNEPFRNADGNLLFRPAGHGALIGNLNDLDSDLIFIKNIDNIVPDRFKPENNLYKKSLAGCLLTLRDEVFSWLQLLEKGEATEQEIQQVKLFAEEDLCLDLGQLKGMDIKQSQQALFEMLNKPIRVCGMVKNVGEPGGGPFWVSNRDGSIGLQIVESSQVNMDDPIQKTQFQQATHFNPVDLVCGVRDYKGNKFNLLNYIDHSTGFISIKSKDGRDLKAMELPGLWNGAMAGWISVFVEVPLITFNPVKTVNDLLRKEHQES